MQSAQAASPQNEEPAKQAIVVIHGMGEQMPMGTIREFVRAVWETDSVVTGVNDPKRTKAWSKPDIHSGSLELRRLTTRHSVKTHSFPGGVRSHFYELYWADLSGGSTWSHVQDWLFGLLFRRPIAQVPRGVRLAWVMLWILAGVVVTFVIAAAMPSSATLFGVSLWAFPPLEWLKNWQAWQLVAVAALLALIATRFVVPYFGRVVRYTRAKPVNIDARAKIRRRGLDLLAALHEAGEYERIVVVGHSLGSIVAYDLVSYFWAARPDSHRVSEGADEFEALRELEAAADRLTRSPSAKTREDFRTAQRALCRWLRRRKWRRGQCDTRWLITDLVTVGSPLTHAEFLLVKDKDELERRIDGREFPTCPPVREPLEGESLQRALDARIPASAQADGLFSFPDGRKDWQLHHAAPYAVVRWTNIHDPARLVFLGDIISGPVGPVFGPGVRDIDLREARRRQAFSFTHLKYWRMTGDTPAEQTVQLREAIDLAGRHSGV